MGFWKKHALGICSFSWSSSDRKRLIISGQASIVLKQYKFWSIAVNVATTVLYFSWVTGKNYRALLFLRNRLQRLCWIFIQSAELLMFLYSSWWDNAPAGETCFYFHFLPLSPPHSVFSLISSFPSILPFPSCSWARWDFVCATCFSRFTSAGSFQQILCKRAVCKLQLVEHTGWKETPVYEGSPKAQAEIWITSAWECVCLLQLPCVLVISLFVAVAILNWQYYFLPSWCSKRVRKIFLN